jgi:hypothetical protein
MAQERPSEAGFCVVDANADLIATTLVRRLRETAAEMEASVNRLYRGRHAVDLPDLARMDLERTIRRLAYIAETLRDVQRAQDAPAFLEAAE